MNDDERKAIRHVLRELLFDGKQWLREQRPKEVPSSNSQFSALNQQQLDSYLRPRGRGAFEPGKVIQVRPPLHEARLSALWCKWDFEGERGGCWFYLGIWLSKGQFIAFRFEPPEQGDNHNYYHSQPCRTMGWEGDPTYRAMEMPQRNPTWPLAASSSLDLLLCLVVSIHGMKGLRRLEQLINNQAKALQNKLLVTALDKMIDKQVPTP